MMPLVFMRKPSMLPILSSLSSSHILHVVLGELNALCYWTLHAAYPFISVQVMLYKGAEHMLLLGHSVGSQHAAYPFITMFCMWF